MDLLCRVLSHKWEHCKCARCGTRRNEEHAWDGCVCAVCGIKRDEGHSFELIPGSYREVHDRYDHTSYATLKDTHAFKCAKCGKTRFEAHRWTGRGCITKCAVCGAMPVKFDALFRGSAGVDVSHQWTGDTCRDTCALCGIRRPNSHRWTGETCRDRCEVCGQPYPKGHEFELAGSSATAYGTKVGVFRCRYCGKEYEEPYEFSSSDSV